MAETRSPEALARGIFIMSMATILTFIAAVFLFIL